jgi:hypothetical protein
VKTFKAKTVIYYKFYLSQASGKWVCLNTEIIIIFSLNTMFFLSFLTAVRTAMPDFHRKMQDKLRTPEEEADTIQIFSGVCVAQSLVFRVVFYGAVNFGHSIVCPWMYSFRIPL